MISNPCNYTIVVGKCQSNVFHSTQFQKELYKLRELHDKFQQMMSGQVGDVLNLLCPLNENDSYCPKKLNMVLQAGSSEYRPGADITGKSGENPARSRHRDARFPAR